MSYHDREKEILSLLSEREFIRVHELAACLYVSEPTVRRDLTVMAKKGLVIRTHGGVTAKINAADEAFALSLREQVQGTAKSVIGKKAAGLIHDGSVILMDGSTSAFSVLPYLAEHKDLIVITNGAKTSLALGRMGIKNFCTGGQMINETMAYVGRHAEAMVSSVNADLLLFSARGLTEDGSFSDSSIEENNLRRVMMTRARRRVMLLDSSKLGKAYIDVLCRAEDVTDVVCETSLPAAITEKIGRKSR